MKSVAFALGLVLGFALLSVVAIPVSPVMGGLVFGAILAMVA